VTLEVTPEQPQKILLATNIGKSSLIFCAKLSLKTPASAQPARHRKRL
jgi:hypothetical protein